jgi:hypothetical protein
MFDVTIIFKEPHPLTKVKSHVIMDCTKSKVVEGTLFIAKGPTSDYGVDAEIYSYNMDTVHSFNQIEQ